MTGRSRAQQEMIDAIDSTEAERPMTLLYLTRNGADMKIQAGRSGDRTNQQLTMAATYLLFLEEQTSGDLREVATEVAAVAEEMRDDDDIGEVHWGGDLDDE